MKYTIAQIVLDKGQLWPRFVRPATEGIDLPAYITFIVGEAESRGFGNRVLTLKTGGVKVRDGIDAAMAIAAKLGLNATVVRSDEHFMELCASTSGNLNIYVPAGYKSKAEHLAGKLDLRDNRGNPSISALFRYLIDNEINRKEIFAVHDNVDGRDIHVRVIENGYLDYTVILGDGVVKYDVDNQDVAIAIARDMLYREGSQSPEARPMDG